MNYHEYMQGIEHQSTIMRKARRQFVFTVTASLSMIAVGMAVILWAMGV